MPNRPGIAIVPSASGKIQNIGEALRWIEPYLAKHGDEHPRASAQHILSLATGLSRVELYTAFDRPFSEEERVIIREAIKRRAKGEPLQYISGEVAFRRIVLKVEPGVLIPRPETEVLVQVGLDFLQEKLRAGADVHELRVLDLCTGSGCIALSLAHELPGLAVTATDISPQALACAARNARALGLEDAVMFFEGDLEAALPALDEGECSYGFDLVISNPPYIPTEELATLPREVVGFEPALALDGGSDGLLLFERILAASPVLLAEDAMLACELFEDSLEAAREKSVKYFHRAEIVDDLAGRNRILKASGLRVE